MDQDRDRRGHRARLFALLASLAIVGSVALAACGGGDGTAEGGEVTIAQTSQPDALDPALSATVNGLEPMWLVYTPLYTYRRAEGTKGAELIPGLAKDMPEISSDGKTYTVTLRDGLVYSNGTPVKASDFEHTIKRVLNLETGASYYQGIPGATKYLNAGNPDGDISGIEADDTTGEITIELTRPDASFTNKLAMNYAGVVPGDTPFKNMTLDPPAGVGPYMITESEPNRQFVLEKNPEFAALQIPDIPTGKLDTITTEIVKNTSQQAQDVLANELDYMQDAPPADLLPTIEQQASDRLEEHPASSTYWFFLNSQTPPFDDPKVREAVNYGIDRSAFARLFGGLFAPGCSFLPPGMPGYDEAFDTTECPYGDPTQPPDIAKAQALIKQAGAEGAKVTVWGNSDDPNGKITEAYADMLNNIGLDATPKILDGSVYWDTIGDPNTKAQTGFDDWYESYPHPLDFFVNVEAEGIPRPNHGYVDDAHINGEINRLARKPDLESVAGDWSELDRYVVAPPHSYLAPYGHSVSTTFLSDRLDPAVALFNPVYLNDYSSWALKSGN